MGGASSKKSWRSRSVESAAWGGNRQQFDDDNHNSRLKTAAGNVSPPPPQRQHELSDGEENIINEVVVYESDDDLYDGIPRYRSSLSQKSSSVGFNKAKVVVSSRLGRAGSLGLGKAVQVLDTLGSSVTNLNSGTGFVAAAPAKGNEIAIISFEIANTIVKGSNLMQSLSKRSMRQLKEAVLPSDGVQHLVSKDADQLLRIVAADKREDLQIFSGEVVRFGNRCKDPQWHNLDRYFHKITRELTPQKHLQTDANSMIQQLMALVQYTAELYHEFHALDRFEQDYERKGQEEDNLVSTQRDGKPAEGPMINYQRLGPAGLSLHYANIVLQIDSLVARSSSMPSNTRDTLYQSLPPNIKSSLRSKLQSFHVKEELTIPEIKAEMEKTLHWLVPVATNTAKAHHGFGWVGEWANTGSEANRKPASLQTDVIRIETFHHANKEKAEACVLSLVLWLHHLACQSKSSANSGGMRSPVKSTAGTLVVKSNTQPKDTPTDTQSSMLTTEDEEML